MFKKFFLKVLPAVMAINFLSVTPVQASIETVTGTGEYIMSMKETPEFAQQNAKLYAERAAIEQAGIFIASVSISKNFQLQDEITTFALGLLKKNQRYRKQNDSIDRQRRRLHQSCNNDRGAS